MDTWKEHVKLEIIDATWDENKLLEITNALVSMDQASLIPQPISDELFDTLTVVNERR